MPTPRFEPLSGTSAGTLRHDPEGLKPFRAYVRGQSRAAWALAAITAAEKAHGTVQVRRLQSGRYEPVIPAGR